MPKRKIVERIAKLSQTQSSNHRHNFADSEIELLRTRLLAWYDVYQRELPWRAKAKDETDVNKRAYAVWVSEVMLQQTQVATVIDYYNKWMKKWPTLQDFAKASLEEVNEVWSGLGYYCRGQRLYLSACKIVHELNGQMPQSANDLAKLQGVGRYTACAIASIACNECVGLVDGNVSRVLSRLRVIGADISSNLVIAELWRLADEIVDPLRPGDFNQALMELGATLCTAKSPQCSKCPVKSVCLAKIQEEKYKQSCATKLRKTSSVTKLPVSIKLCDIEDCVLCLPADDGYDFNLGVTNYPRKGKKKPPRIEKRAVCVLNRRLPESETFLIVQRPDKGLLANMWEFPGVDIPLTATDRETHSLISQYLESTFALNNQISKMSYITEVIHIFSHIHQTYKVFTLTLAPDMNFDSSGCNQPMRWVSVDEYDEAAMSTAMRKVFRAVHDAHDSNNREAKKSSTKRENKISKGQLSMESFLKKR